MARKNKQGSLKVAEPKLVWRRVAEPKTREQMAEKVTEPGEQVAEKVTDPGEPQVVEKAAEPKTAEPLSELESGWTLVQKGITNLRNRLEGVAHHVSTGEEYILLYTVLEDYKQLLYDRIKVSIEEYTNTTVLPALREEHDEYMLRELVKGWDNHKIMLRWFSRLFHCLDRYLVPKRNLPDLNEVGLMCFQDQVYVNLKNYIKDSVIAMIDREREGEQIDRALLGSTLDIFFVMGMGSMDAYQKDFEPAMLDDTTTYYSRKAAAWIDSKTCPDYMLKAEECLKREKERIGHYLHSSTEENLLERVQDELLAQYENRLLEKEHSGFHVLLGNDKVEDLSRMYRLFCKIPNGLEPISTLFRQHIEEKGNTLVNQANHTANHMKAKKKDANESQGQDVVGMFIELHEKYLQQVRECFQDHSGFHKALKAAFEAFSNKIVTGKTSGELFATFCDNLLKKAGIEGDDEDFEDTLEKVEKLFTYINDRDLFAEFCQKKLARRLLAGKRTNDDHERSLLAKIKQHFGWKLTSRMQGMVNDLAQAREDQNLLKEYLKAKSTGNPNIDITMRVLTNKCWPNYCSSNLAVPLEMVKCVEVCTDYYQSRTANHSKTANRKLNWMYSLGTCHINVNFDSKPIELILTHYQAAVLFLFTSEEKLSYAEIKEMLNLGHGDIARLLHSLSCATHKILKKDPSTNTVTQADSFEFNTKFVNKMRRMKIPLPPLDERSKIMQDVDKDRSQAIDASIIRIMKSRRVLHHQQLVVECTEQLGKLFKPDFKVIKKRIEDLIHREYLERDEDDFNTYKYLA